MPDRSTQKTPATWNTCSTPPGPTLPLAGGISARAGLEAMLDGCVLLLPILLSTAARGAAPLAAAAGLVAAGLIAATPPWRFAALRPAAAIFAALVAWGALSAAWSIDSWRSLVLDARIAGLFAAALALAGAASRVAAPRRLFLCLVAGTTIGIVLAGYDMASAGGLNQWVSTRPFIAPRLNPLAVWLAILVLPAAGLLWCQGRRLLAAAAAIAMAGGVCLLDGTTAKVALALSLPLAALCYAERRAVARIAAALSVLAIVAAPFTLPQLARFPGVFAAVDSFKESAGHRLLIWSFAGDRIAERPFVGWGLDAARAIPGGKDEIRPGESWLPLHPHDAALQLWLELGSPGAALLALLVGWLWLRLADAPWPRVYTAAVGGSLCASLAASFSAWGIWQEWWIGTLALALFTMIAMGRSAAPLVPGATPPRRRGWRGGGR
jgi:O-antigen ligase